MTDATVDKVLFKDDWAVSISASNEKEILGLFIEHVLYIIIIKLFIHPNIILHMFIKQDMYLLLLSSMNVRIATFSFL